MVRAQESSVNAKSDANLESFDPKKRLNRILSVRILQRLNSSQG